MTLYRTAQLISMRKIFTTILLGLALLFAASLRAQSTGFVQGTSGGGSSSYLASVNATFGSSNVAGDLLVVRVNFLSTTATVSVADTSGNTWTALPIQRGTRSSQQIFYCNGCSGASSDKVTAIVNSGSAAYFSILIAEYSGFSGGLDVTAAASGTNSSPNSGFATTTSSNDLLLGFATSDTGLIITGPGSGYTKRLNMLEDKIVTATGSCNATYTYSGTGYWICQMVAFSASAAPTPTPVPPPTPTPVPPPTPAPTPTPTPAPTPTPTPTPAPTPTPMPGPTTYYVSPTGSDSNDGISPSTPWQTISKVNATSYNAGDSILFSGGRTFNGGLDINAAGTPIQPVIIGSYGTGHAMINAGTGEGFFAYNYAGIVIQHIDFQGSGAGTNTANGIEFYADLGGNVTLPYIRIDDVDVGGFGKEGITIGTWSNLTGYTDVRVTNAQVHDNGMDGMQVYAQTKGAITNIYVGYCQFYNNTGKAGLSNPSGSGVVFGEVNGATIEQCQAFHNGASNTSTSGPVGIWCYDSSYILIQYNESYGNLTSGGDGDGFDLDGGTTNSYLQYNYSHDNAGGGLCLFQYSGASAHSGNLVRYNLSQNDKNGISIWAANSSSPVSSDKIYNNIISVGSGAGIFFTNTNCSGLTFNNNIVATSNGKTLLSFPGTSGAAFNFDDYWAGSSAFVISWNGTTYSNLSSFKTASGQEGSGQNVDPSPFSGSVPAYWRF
jgi:Right handed beta helix region